MSTPGHFMNSGHQERNRDLRRQKDTFGLSWWKSLSSHTSWTRRIVTPQQCVVITADTPWFSSTLGAHDQSLLPMGLQEESTRTSHPPLLAPVYPTPCTFQHCHPEGKEVLFFRLTRCLEMTRFQNLSDLTSLLANTVPSPGPVSSHSLQV